VAEVQTNKRVRDSSSDPDRRRGGPLNRVRRGLIWLIHNRWVAMLMVAFAVSWSFHEVDELQEREHERQMEIMACTIAGVAQAQAISTDRIRVGPILEACQKRAGN
jgi:hypothetical protein